MPPSLPKDVSMPSPVRERSSAAEKESSTQATAATSSASSDYGGDYFIGRGLRGSMESLASELSASKANGDAEERWYYYLSPDAARRLPRYQYDGTDLSLLYKYVLSPFAAWCVDHLTPPWVSPNAITLLGLAFMASSYCTIWYYCPGMYEANADLGVVDYAVPASIFLWNGCAMLIYQTLDNMDGKQARKTGSSSPLGLLFDHGCDAMNSIFGSANWIATMAMVPGNVGDLLGHDNHDNIQNRSLVSEFLGGDAMVAALMILFPMLVFYISTWEQYYTGKLVFPPFNGPSEGLVVAASLGFFTFFLGSMFWQQTSLTDGAVAKLENYFGETTYSYLSPLEGRVRNMDLVILACFAGSVQEVVIKTFGLVRSHGLQTLRTLVPHLLLVGSTLAMVYCDQTLFLRRPRMIMHLISGLFTEQVTQMMFDHMVEEKFEVRKRWCLFPLVLLALWMLSGVAYSPSTLDTILLVYNTGLWVYLAFKISVQIHEVCDVLGIWCFDIVTPHPKKLAEGAEGEDGKKKTN